MRKFWVILGIAALGLAVVAVALLVYAGWRKTPAYSAGTDGLMFIHHSVGANWLGNSLEETLAAKDYIGARNDIFYGTDVVPDAGRPDSLGPVPGDLTDMNHWIFWFNDYLESVKTNRLGPSGRLDRLFSRLPVVSRLYHGLERTAATNGLNKIVMIKSCYPNSDVLNGTGPGDPFSSEKTVANYQALYRHPDGAGKTYAFGKYAYKPLETIFAENPDTLFVVVTSPPLNYGPADGSTDEHARNARAFNNWLKNDWLSAYNAANPGLNNVAVFDLFDALAYSDDNPEHPNRLKEEFGGNSGDPHPNATANTFATQLFAANPDNFLDQAWQAFNKQ